MEAKICITNGTRSVSIEGSETFVLKQLEELRPHWEPSSSESAPAQTEAPGKSSDSPPKTNTNGLPGTFGEYLSQFPKGINQDEQVLVAGYFTQKQSEDDIFTTGEANALLKEQGIKVGNASQSVTNNMSAKRIFAFQKSKYRVSKIGTEHIEKLLGE